MEKYVQYIVLNRGLKMSRGKIAAQAAHAAMAPFTHMMRQTAKLYDTGYNVSWFIPKDMFDNWINESFTKIVLAVDSEDEMNEVINNAIAADMKENSDYFVIRDNCLTELTPDETGTRMTAIGFKPMIKEKLKGVTDHLPLFR